MRAIRIAGSETRGEPERRPRPPSREVRLAVDGTFDLAAAVRTAAAARGRPVSARVTIDLRRARIDDAALAAFMREMTGRAIAIIGLSRHHERLLRYLEDGSGTERRAEE